MGLLSAFNRFIGTPGEFVSARDRAKIEGAVDGLIGQIKDLEGQLRAADDVIVRFAERLEVVMEDRNRFRDGYVLQKARADKLSDALDAIGDVTNAENMTPEAHAEHMMALAQSAREHATEEPKCVNAHDRCYGGAGAPCPYCE